jgi:hypothetical protein
LSGIAPTGKQVKFIGIDIMAGFAMPGENVAEAPARPYRADRWQAKAAAR